MSFNTGDEIMYPIHGSGVIINISQESFNGQVQNYYEIKLYNSNIEVSLPVQKAREVGVRSPISRDELEECLDSLRSIPSFDETVFSTLSNFSKDKLNSGITADAVEVIQILEYKRIEKSKLTYSESKNLETAINFIRAETIMVTGDDSMLDNYEVFIDKKDDSKKP
jgi:CarD family transcriptional regulator